jgi:hypothetical protein
MRSELQTHGGVLSQPLMRALLTLLPLFLAGCAGVPPGSPQPNPSAAELGYVAEEPAPSSSGKGGDAVALPPLKERLQALALQEWQLWGRGRWHAATGITERRRDEPRRVESEPAQTARVQAYWLAFKPRPFDARKMHFDDGSVLPWSAAFISWLMVGAGVPEPHFEVNELHWAYIRSALEQGRRVGFEALDAATTAPALGDVICAPRDAASGAPQGFAAWKNLPRPLRAKRWAWHCDLVVNISGSEVGAIGGNVSDSVSWTRAPLNAGGLLEPTAERPWTVILRHNANRGP